MKVRNAQKVRRLPYRNQTAGHWRAVREETTG